MKCIICSKPTLKNTRNHLITRYGVYRKYCSNACTKTAYRRAHPDKDNQSKQKWLENNPEKRAQASDKYRKRNSAYYAQYASLRTRYMKQAKPGWVDEDKLIEFYILAKELGLEVDHIVPIKHEKVCGLHVPWNLQLLSRSENARKSNKFDEDVVAVLRMKND